MSANVNMALRVDGIRSSTTALTVGRALQQVFVREGITDDVVLNEDPAGAMVWTTPWPLIIAGSLKRWREGFEEAVRSAVGAVVPEAVGTVAPELVVTIEWSYPDIP